MKRQTGWVGLVVEDLSHSDTRGVVVWGVVPGAPADQAALKVMDVILSVNGEQVEDASALRREVAQQCGNELAVKVLRGDSERVIRLQVAAVPR